MTTDLQALVERLVVEFRHLDVAHHEFEKLLADDEELKDTYYQWCTEQGTSRRRGFLDMAEEFLDTDSDRWTVLDNTFD